MIGLVIKSVGNLYTVKSANLLEGSYFTIKMLFCKVCLVVVAIEALLPHIFR